jgi:serralysin
VQVDDPALGASPDATVDFRLDITDANEAPTAVTLDAAMTTLAEGADTSASRKIADIHVTDADGGDNQLALAGADAAFFEIVTGEAGPELHLRAGVALDFETKAHLDVQVQVDDPTVGASPDATVDFRLDITDANEAPTAVALANLVAGVDETAATAATKVADIVITDDALGSNAATLGGADADLFEVRTAAGGAQALWLKAGTALDFESKTQLDVTVTVADSGLPGSTPLTTALSLPVNNVAEQYGNIFLDGNLGDPVEWPAETRLDTETAGAAGFTIRGSYQGGAFVVGIESADVAIGPNTTIWFDTDIDRGTGFNVYGFGAEYNIDFGADGHARLYTGDAGQTFVANLDYGLSADGHNVEIALPSGLVGGAVLADFVLDINNVTSIPGNFAAQGYRVGQNLPPEVALTPTVTSVLENASVLQDLKVADIAVNNPDGFGSATLSLTGADAGFFRIASGALYLKAGVPLDYESHPHLDVTVNVDDPSIGAAGSIESSANFSLAIGDVNEAQGPITLDGTLTPGEWAAGSRLDSPGNGAPGYELYGTYAKETSSFVLGLKTDGTIITDSTTIWLNTDLDRDSGYKIFGFAGGVEYQISFAADGTPSLYALAENGATTLVAQNLDYFYDATHTRLEIAVPSALVGDSRGAGVYVHLNGIADLPNDYSNVQYIVKDNAPLLPIDPSMRIAIVYSETSADHYFNKTAYGQLFMAAQSQAMQAGIPFDILTEDQLTDFQNLVDAQGRVKYDAIVFPDLSHVKASELQAITDTLTTAVHDYKIGLIASGNFLTNDENGAAFSGNAYARSEALLGVKRVGGGTTDTVKVTAVGGSHPVSEHYGAGEAIGTYGEHAYDVFQDVTGSGQTVFNQVVTGGTERAVIATTIDGARNVHFASAAILGNNNILQQAIDWSARGDAPNTPDVNLELTRGTSIFYSRTDLDQSQEHFDTVESNPRIYDALLPILQNWYQQYDFVGSYYANVGADASEDADRWTDWSVSAPFYQALIAMGNEIGTHSYTHPEDTNFLLGDDFSTAEWQSWLDHLSTEVSSQVRGQISQLGAAGTRAQLASLLQATDPGTHPNAVSLINGLSDLDRTILSGSYRFQFEYSKEILQQHLGITLAGAAVPGAPEVAATSAEIMKYVSYLSGGYTGVGAGYPGAIGFIDPAHTGQVYFAPNIPFDFSLVEFQHMSAAQAAAAWAAAYDQVVSHGGAPIIHFPWHDYAPMDWDTSNGTGPGNGPGYTLEMFTDFIARAYADGTEFVTGADLAERILTFAQADVEITSAAGQLIAKVGGGDVGRLALDVDTTQVIASVEGWYAYDGRKVFLPRAGGTFEITLGNQAADVTHITKLPMRAELITVSGNGSNLDYSLSGRGDVVIDVKAGGGIVARGADDAAMSGQLLTLTHSADGAHAGHVGYRNGNATLAGTDGDDFLFGSGAGTGIHGGRGHDVLTGGGGADDFLFAVGDGADTVRDFNLAEDHVELHQSGFADAAAALAAFTYAADGATLALSATDRLTLANVTEGQLTASHILLSNDVIA